MKRIFALLLAALVLSGACLAESEGDFLEDFELSEDGDALLYDFSDEGYEGQWVRIPALKMRFCLPAGWTEQPAAEGAVFAAEKDGGDAGLAVSLLAEDVADLEAWAAEAIPDGGFELSEAGLYSAMVREEGGALNVCLLTDGCRVMEFRFRRDNAEALPTELGLNIAASLYEDVFGDEDWSEGDGEESDEAAAEAFAASLGDLEAAPVES